MQLDVFSLGLYALLLLMFAGGLFQYLFYRRLRRVHTEVWRELGSPTMFLNASIRNQAVMTKYIWGRKHDELDDPKIGLLARAIRALGIAVAALFVLLLLVTFVFGQGTS